MQLDGLAAVYSSKTDDELLRLAADQESLREEARDVLAEELRRRNLENSQSEHGVEDSVRASQPDWLRRLTWLGLWFLNTLIATVGVVVSVGLFTYSIRSFLVPPVRTLLVGAPYFPLPVLVALFAGFFPRLRFRGSYRYWVWPLPAILTFGAMLGWQSSNHGGWAAAIHHFFGHLPYRQTFDQDATTLFLYLTLSYSLGALVQSIVESRSKTPSAEQSS